MSIRADELSGKTRALKYADKCGNHHGHGFNLTLTQWDALFNDNPVCAYSGHKFKDGRNLTIERIDPNKGYVDGNVCLVTSEANGVKAHLDAFEKHEGIIGDEMKVKLLNKVVYRLNKRIKAAAARKEQMSAKIKSGSVPSFAREMMGKAKK